MPLTEAEKAHAHAAADAAGPIPAHLHEQISELLLSTSASGASHEPGGPPSSGDAGASDGAVEHEAEAVR